MKNLKAVDLARLTEEAWSTEREKMIKTCTKCHSENYARFISKKGRPFKAYLVKNPDGRVGFEFEPRKPKAGSAAASPPAQATAVAEAPKPATRARKPSSRARKAAKPAAKKKKRKA